MTLAMLQAWLLGLGLGAGAFLAILNTDLLTLPPGAGPFDTVAKAIWGYATLIVLFILFAAMFSLPFVLLALSIGWAAPGWTARNLWAVAAIMIALVVVIFGPQDNLLRYSGIGMGSLVSVLFAWRWTRRDVSP